MDARLSGTAPSTLCNYLVRSLGWLHWLGFDELQAEIDAAFRGDAT